MQLRLFQSGDDMLMPRVCFHGPRRRETFS
jgi:hypothetical protein